MQRGFRLRSIASSAFDFESVLSRRLDDLFDAVPQPMVMLDAYGAVLCTSDDRPGKAAPATAVDADLPLRLRLPPYLEALEAAAPWPERCDAACSRALMSGGYVHERLSLRRTDWGACLSVFDISAERRLRAADQQETRLAALGFMVAGVCHEVTNPLTSLHSIVQLLRSESPPSPELLDKGLDNIAINVKRILEISRRLVTFSRVGDDARERFAVDDAVEAALNNLRQQSALRDIEVIFGRDAGATVHGDRGQVQQIFLNLFVNAVQAMNGRGTLRIEHGRDGARVEVSVGDSGPGIAPDHVGRIFEPFFTTRSSTHGTGLGLSLSAEIAAEHGGRIELRRNAPTGATFCVSLQSGSA